MSKGITTFDLSEFLDSDDAICEYLTQVLDDGDMEEAKRALGYVAKAKGMAAIAEQTGLGRASLYKTLKPETKPRFDTMLRILHAAGLRLRVEPIAHH
jgi:probable addiction module antidote protein